MLCDFCAEIAVRCFDTPDSFMDQIGAQTLASEGAWAACAPCAALIDLSDWAGLEKRAIDILLPKFASAAVTAGVSRDYLLSKIVQAQTGFRLLWETRKRNDL
jgi:hypothetical protein